MGKKNYRNRNKKNRNKSWYDDQYPYDDNQYFENGNGFDSFYDKNQNNLNEDYINGYKSFSNQKNNRRKNDRNNYQADNYTDNYQADNYQNSGFEYYDDYCLKNNDHYDYGNNFRKQQEFYRNNHNKKNKNKNYIKNLSQKIFANNDYENGYDSYETQNSQNYYEDNGFNNNKNNSGNRKNNNYQNDYDYKKPYKKNKKNNCYDNFYGEPKYFENQIEVDTFDYENDAYENQYNQNNYSDRKKSKSDYGDDSGDKKRKFSFKGDKKKKTIFTIFISTIVVCFLIVAIVLIVFFLVNRNAPTGSSRETLSHEYMKDESQTSKNAMDYITHRTFSMQFLYSNSQRDGKIINGTGWIFNKEKDKDIYYIATNVHVAAALNYGGKDFTENGTENNFTNLSLTNVYLGYVNLNMNESVDQIYDDKNLKIVDLGTNIPEIVYLPDASDMNSTFGKSYSSYNSKFGNYKQVIDFSILKFDLSSSKSSNSDFANWLKVYDSTPTEFSSEPINLSDENKFNEYIKSTEFFMGGFPSLGNKNNKGKTEWIGFSKFKTASSLNNNNDVINESNYNGLASGIHQYLKKGDNWEPNKIDYFNEKNEKIEYLNVGFYWLLAAKSAGGSSGSMLIKETSRNYNKFEVVGIYWGTQQIRIDSNAIEGFLTEAIVGAPSVGVANMLNYTNYFVSDTEKFDGIDIFYDATQKITNNNSVELVYKYESKNKLYS
ncbi:MAG: DUF31 family protein, partial [Malacoplasma sp.]|nr:DUF31 family protein [Malacoplasma sp.]